MSAQDLAGSVEVVRRYLPTQSDRTLEQEALLAGGDDWGLFTTGGGEHPWLELQRVDFPEDHEAIFEDDQDAWRHVLKLAGEGSRPEKCALAYLCIESHEEIVGIFYSMYFGEYRTYLQPQEH